MSKAKKARASKRVAKHDAVPQEQTATAGNDNNQDSVHSGKREVRIEANPEILRVINELRVLEDSKKRLQELADGYREKIMDYMGLNQVLASGSFTLATWKSYQRKSVDLTSLKKEMPDLYDSYTRETLVRVFKLC